MDLNLWWSNLQSFERFFWFLAIPFTVVFLFQFLLTFIGNDGNAEIDGDFDSDGVGDSGFHLFTFTNIIIFFTAFGWAGIVGIGWGFSQVVTVIFAFLVGIALMVAVASIYYLMSKMVESGNINLQNALNSTGKVYLPIPANRGGVGKVQITVQGSFREVDAVTDGDLLQTGMPIKVVGILNDEIIIVEKI